MYIYVSFLLFPFFLFSALPLPFEETIVSIEYEWQQLQNSFPELGQDLLDDHEKAICFLEEHIPELVDSAIRQAYWRALASGNNVLESRNGVIVEIHPDGSERVIKRLPAPIPVKIGQILELKPMPGEVENK